MTTRTSEEYELDQDVPVKRKLVLYNSRHFWDDVVTQLHKATGFDLVHCEQIAMIAHTTGKAVVKSGDCDELIKIDSVLKEISLVTEIQ
ncbi:MAG: ATP-dependent Clp protease adaptor ClpS [Ignavibacteria bacterium]|nr:ATP-dependent Clp protease adaptor ClpS [Ignavibacteria bacterium]